MADDHRISITSSSSDLQSEGSEYTYHTDSSNEHPSLPQAVERKCVCKLSVKFLLEHRRFVNNSQNSHVGVGYWNSFQDQVDNDYFPFSLGGKCVDVGGGENWEFWVEYYDMQCLACGNMTEFNMYQDILRFEKGVDGCMRAKLSWFMDFYDQSQKYSCILWRLDRKENAEDGAVFGIWGAEGPHAGLACRVVAQHRSSDRNNLPCLQNRTGEQLVQLLRNNRVYMAGIKEAERTLRQQLETGTPTWDTYGRWKFPEGVQSSTDSFGYDGVYARCAACYTCCTGKHRCEKTLRLRKLVLKPFRHRKFRVLAYRIDTQTEDEKFVFFSKRREDDTLRFLRTDWKYTDLALRFVRKGNQFNGPTISQHHGPRKPYPSKTVGQKRTNHCIDAAGPRPQKRMRADSTGFNPINGQQSDERTAHFRHTSGRSEQPLQAASCSDGYSDPQSHPGCYGGQQNGSPLCQSDGVGSGDGRYHSTSGSHPDEAAAHLALASSSSHYSSRPIITQEQIEKVRRQNEELKVVNGQKQYEMLELHRCLQEREQNAMRHEYELVMQQAEEEKAKMVELDTQIGVLKRALDVS